MTNIPSKLTAINTGISEPTILNEGLCVWNNSNERIVLQSDCPFPIAQEKNYFEIKILRFSDNGKKQLAIAEQNEKCCVWGIGDVHTDYKISLFHFDKKGLTSIKYVPDAEIKEGDYIGIGYDKSNSQCFATLNGHILADLPVDLNLNGTSLIPRVALDGEATMIEVNFGRKPFVYQGEMYQCSLKNKGFLDQWRSRFGETQTTNDTMFGDYLTDITLVSKDGKEIDCHRIVLSVQSEVFKAMFEPDKQTGMRVHIPEFDGDTIRKMVHFIYTDKIDEDNSEVDMDLLMIANKYMLHRLQDLCTRSICQTIDIENVLEAWMAANLVQDKQFITICEEFVYKNWRQVTETQNFEEMKLKNSEKLNFLLIDLVDTTKPIAEQSSMGV